MKYSITVREQFSASHQLKDYEGKCKNLHGHNYIVELTVSSKTLDKHNMVIDFGILKYILKNILNDLDHKHLNDVLKCNNPTCEYIAKYIYNIVKETLFMPIKVKVYETLNQWVEVEG